MQHPDTPVAIDLPEPRARERMLIAVVDDEASVRRALVRVLRVSHFDTADFASGAEFLHSLRFQRPDCLVLDIHMAGLTGRDVQRALALMQVRVPSIIMTAHADPGLREECLAAGAHAYLRKPPRAEELLANIRMAIARPRND